MTPQAKWAAETGLDPDDYSVWDGNQSAQRVKAHRWALARADEYCPEGIHIVTNRNCGSVQLVKGHEVATLDVDEEASRPRHGMAPCALDACRACAWASWTRAGSTATPNAASPPAPSIWTTAGIWARIRISA